MCFRALKSGQNSLCSLLIVDTPGFQNPRLVKRECSATFEDLCHNYTQERLHEFFHQRTFVHELERYKEARTYEIFWATNTHTHVLSSSPSSFSLSLLSYVLSRHINSNSANLHISDTPSLPPVMGRDKLRSCVRASH